ncbi:NADH:flavin oxidoreductase/NADH oxidase [Dichomitus squalens]|uniref:NADH:flavin oxidoreductase/NADH oxidase n=1 Tax=Dichomitus squalens TaxID=114155 RepID=A0A4Q9Q3I6_9APHY|nr:NADH:flavin oxidoreductase/NADH oxidase [Dichomitus squalens]
MSSTSSSTPALFSPIQVGDLKLAHRVVLAPLTRFRNDDAHVPTDLGVEYYSQRASVPGTLLITEATFISPEASGLPNAPGIWSNAQVAAWKKIVDAVHAKGSYIYLQLWAVGRTARPAVLHEEFPDVPFAAPSPIALSTQPEAVPRELTKEEIKKFVQQHAVAAKNAVEGAGFDGVEVHGANGYLVDQFLQDVSNKRTDEYGGSLENRARFGLEVIDAVVKAVGATKSAIRLSPWSTYQDMHIDDPIPQFTYFVEQLKQRHPQLAFVHVASPKIPGSIGPKDESQVDFIHKIWAPGAVITTGGYDRESGIKAAEETGQLIGYGTKFLANPDLPFRLRENLPLNPPDFETFYTRLSPKGYIDYPFSEEFLKSQL